MTRFSRWIPAFSMLLVSLISYIDRSTLALLAPTILRETHLSGEQYGFIISAFSVAYMISNPLWGRVLDRIGLRAGMTLAVSAWTLASVAHAFAAGFFSFAGARAALGFGEGATFPGGLRTVVQTLPVHERGRGTAVAYSGGSLGAIVTPLIVTPIALWWGWRAAFLFTGFIGFGWLALWFFVARRPDVRRVSAARAIVPPHLGDARLWSFMLAYALGGVPLGFVLYQGAIYLSRAFGKSQAFIGAVLWIPPLGWELGYFFFGWLFDRMIRAGTPHLKAVNRMMLAAMLLSLPLAFVPWISNVWIVMAELFFAMFIIGCSLISSISYATHVFSGDNAGLIAGAGAGSWSAIVALLMPLFGHWFDVRRYDLAFAVAAVFPAIGYCAWWAVNRGSAGPWPARRSK